MQHGLLLTELQARVTDDDGDLPNGRAANVGVEGWRAFLAVLRTTGWSVTWDETILAAFPETLDDLMTEDVLTLHVEPKADVRMNVFPSWGFDHVWFDFSIRELNSQSDADALFEFVRLLGRSVGRPVALSYEGPDDHVFATYDPGDDAIAWS